MTERECVVEPLHQQLQALMISYHFLLRKLSQNFWYSSTSNRFVYFCFTVFFLLKFEWKHQKTITQGHTYTRQVKLASPSITNRRHKKTNSSRNNSEFLKDLCMILGSTVAFKCFARFNDKHKLNHVFTSTLEIAWIILGIVFFIMRATRIANTEIEMERLNQLFFSVIRKVLFHTLPHTDTSWLFLSWWARKLFHQAIFHSFVAKIEIIPTPNVKSLGQRLFSFSIRRWSNILQLNRQKIYAINVS